MNILPDLQVVKESGRKRRGIDSLSDQLNNMDLTQNTPQKKILKDKDIEEDSQKKVFRLLEASVPSERLPESRLEVSDYLG